MYVWKPLSPSQPQQLDLGIAFGISDIGRVRVSNEDNFLIDHQLGLVAIADGMGGHEAGEVASADALLSLSHYIRAITGHGDAITDFTPGAFDPADADPDGRCNPEQMATMTTLNAAVEFANHRMFQMNMENQFPVGAGMGTTLTGFWQPVAGGPLFVFHVGDTRLYRLRQGRLNQLTRDQTLYQQALDLGVRHNLPGRNLLLQALGPSSQIRPELQHRVSQPGDIFMLCSDGLYGATAHEDMTDILNVLGPTDLRECCARLIELAKLGGSRDNITVVLLRCE